MQLEALHVFHLPKKGAKLPFLPQGALGFQDQAEVFFIETCQRYLWVGFSGGLGESFSRLNDVATQVFRGREAYLFLLRVTAGLESEVIGETDVFGQVKEAWRKIAFSGSRLSMSLGPWMQRVFEDTKEIRTRYLQNLGGASYGALVRKLIKDQSQSTQQGPVLLVGAGQIAQSVGPFLTDSELWLWNRSQAHLCALSQDLEYRSQFKVTKLTSPEAERKGWREAAHVVVCIPLDAVQDPLRLKWFQEGGVENRSVIHLGDLREKCGIWNSLPRFYSLNEVFDLQNSLGNIRSVQVTQAERASEERAQLRALGASLSIPHGWEDLACFA